jgi:hypothetical protein
MIVIIPVVIMLMAVMAVAASLMAAMMAAAIAFFVVAQAQACSRRRWPRLGAGLRRGLGKSWGGNCDSKSSHRNAKQDFLR